MANLSNVLKIKDSITGEWIEIPALKGNDGKDAYAYAVEGGFTGTEAEFITALGNAGDYATKTELATEATTRAEEDAKLQEAIDNLKTEVGDDVAAKLESIEKEIEDIETDIESIEDELEKKANAEDVYTKTEVDSKLSSVYKYQGSVADFDSLPTENLTAGDVYNTEATGDNYAWTGTEWDKLAGMVDLSEYAKSADVTTEITTAIEAEKAAREAADTALQTAIDAEATTRETADNALQAAIDAAIAAAITTHNDLTGRDAEDCHPMSAITGLEAALEEINTELEDSIGTAVEELEGKIDTLETEMDAVEGRLDTAESDITDLKDNTYTKTEIDGIVASVYKYKGSVADYASLPTEDLVIGDVYNTEETGDNYAWTGTEWDKLAGVVDLSEYAKSTDVTAEITAAVEAEKTAREAADAVLQAAIDEIELTPGEDGKSGVYVGETEPDAEEGANVWINPNGIPTVSLLELQTQIADLTARIEALEA